MNTPGGQQGKKKLFWAAAALLVLSLIPLFLIARFNHPCADDFSYGGYTVHIWRQTHSPAAVLAAAADGVATVYRTWQGSFSAVFLMALQPAIFSETLYMIFPVLLLISFAAANFWLLKRLIADVLGAGRVDCWIVACGMVFFSVQFVLSPVEAFYWYNGAMYYTGFHTLSLVLFALLLKAGSRRSPRAAGTILYGAGTLALGFVIGGGNLITALTSALYLGVAVLLLLLKKGGWRMPALVLLGLCGGLLLNVMAPGNALRQVNFHGMGAVPAVFQSFWFAAKFVFYFTRISVLLGFACLTPVLYRIAKNSSLSFRLPGVVTALCFALFASNFTPNLYAMSSFGMTRVINVNQYQYLYLLLIVLFYWCGWISRRGVAAQQGRKRTPRQQKEQQSFMAGIQAVLAGCFLISCLVVSGAHADTMAGVSAAGSLLTGEAQTYHRENLARQAVYLDPSEPDAIVAPFSVEPHVLFFDDITADPSDWRNTALADFYGKASVRLGK